MIARFALLAAVLGVLVVVPPSLAEERAVGSGTARYHWTYVSIDMEDPALLDRGRSLAALGRGGLPACGQCHGFQGDGLGAGGFPRIGGLSAPYLHKQLMDYATGARRNAVMTPIARAMDDADRLAAAAWYASRPVPDLPAPFTEPELLARGAVLHAVGDPLARVEGCANCHGARGEGRPPAIPRLAGQPAHFVLLQFEAWDAGWRANDTAGAMRHIASGLGADDRIAVAAYLESLRASDAGERP